MKKLITSLAAGVLALTLTSCSGAEQTDWATPDEKHETFSQYVCQRDGQSSSVDPGVWATSAAIDVLADSSSTVEDKKIAINITTTPEMYDDYKEWGDPIPAHVVPRTLTPDDSDTCEGWVWEKHLESAHDREYEDFTFEKARAESLI